MSEYTMVERVAKAIDPRAFEVDYQKWFLFKAWQDEAREKAMKQAHAAIEAMREPTEAMVSEVEDPGDIIDGSGALSGSAARSVWRAMIDVALSGRRH